MSNGMGRRQDQMRGIRGGKGGMRMAMTMKPEKARDVRGTVRKLFSYLAPVRRRLFGVLILAIASTVFAILSPKVVGNTITILFSGAMAMLQGAEGAAIDFEAIARLLVLLGILYLFSSLFTFLVQYIMAGVAQETVYRLRREVKEKLTRLPLQFLDSRSHGDILSRFTNDIDLISTTMQQSLTQMITSAVSLLGIVVMMLTISPLLTLLTLFTLPLSINAIRAIAKRSQKFFTEQQHILGELNGHIEEMYTGHREVKAFNFVPIALQAFEEKNEALYSAAWKAQFISGIVMPVMHAINSLAYVIISVVGGIFVMRQIMLIGDIQAFIQYSRQFSRPIQQAAGIVNLMQSTIAAAERVFEILSEEEQPQDTPQHQLESVAGVVEFRNVSFSYLAGVPLIRDMNIRIAPGQSAAIVGPTGAGKTTIVNLLMRFYDIQEGAIMVDGYDIRELSRSNLRDTFGMVLQDAWLFKGTIRENIAYGRESATNEEVVAVARAAHADHFIRTLPDGYDTVLNEDASNISQGQRQLLTIARAFLADPAILILDEATSSVDTRTELIIQHAMAALIRGRTNFIIAHRLSTIRQADIILVMDKGRIVEQGTHDDLLARDGFYADLYNSQFTGIDI